MERTQPIRWWSTNPEADDDPFPDSLRADGPFQPGPVGAPATGVGRKRTIEIVEDATLGGYVSIDNGIDRGDERPAIRREAR